MFFLNVYLRKLISNLVAIHFSGHSNVKETIAKFLSEKLGTPRPLSSQNINLQAGNYLYIWQMSGTIL